MTVRGLARSLITLLYLVLATFFVMAGDKDPVSAKSFRFTENKGQWAANILFRCDIDHGVLFLEKDRLTFVLFEESDLNRILGFKHSPPGKVPVNNDLMLRHHAYQMIFDRADPAVMAEGIDKTDDFSNYFIGQDPKKWATRVRSFHEVYYSGLFPGVDLKIYSQGGLLKYDLILEPGVDPNIIRIRYSGVDGMKIQGGHLVINTSVRKIVELNPKAFQSNNKLEVECSFRLKSNTLSFKFDNGYDRTRPLVIDPVLVFSTYTGSTADNWGYTATYDDDGFVYAGGSVFNTGYPLTVGAYQSFFGGGDCDIAITKFAQNGQTLIYSTYLGGSKTDVPHSLIVNNADELYVFGTTGSDNYPVTAGAYDPTFNGGTPYTLTNVLHYPDGSDIVITRFSISGGNLLSSTYFGGTSNDGLNGVSSTSFVLKHNYADDIRGEIVIDHQNNVLIGSCTRSTNLPTGPTSYHPAHGGGALDGFVAKLDASLSSLIWCTYVGGSGEDAIYSLVINDANQVYASGGTTSQNLTFPSTAIHSSYQGGSTDGFIVRLSAGGSGLISGTYFGSNVYDQIYNIKLDSKGHVYITGQTDKLGNTFIKNAAWNIPDGGQFITKITPDLDSIAWSTAFGTGNGGPDISPNAFMVDLCDNVYFSGWGANYLNGFGGTTGLPITGNAFQSNTDGKDYYFLVLSSNADSLMFATFFGGALSAEHVDGGTSRFDRKGRIYQAVCAGCGNHDDFPTTPNAWSNYNNSSNCNMGVLKIDFDLPFLVADFTKPIVGCAPFTINFQNNSVVPSSGITTYNWSFGDGTFSSQWQPTHTYTLSGLYNVTLIISNGTSCNLSDTLMRQVLVLSNSRDTLPSKHFCIGDYTQIGITPVNDPTVTYNWISGAYLTSTTIANPITIAPVTTEYVLVVSNGICSDTLIQRVFVYDLKLDAGPDTTLCHNNIKLTAHTPNDSMFFIWSTSPNFTNPINPNPLDSSILVSLTSPTTFYVYMYNAYCSTFDSVKVDFLMFLNTGSSENPSCFNDCDGVADVTTTGGLPPYSYTWSNGGSITSHLTNLCAGLYTVTVTDANGCFASITIPLFNPQELFTNPVITDAPCEEACVGQADAGASGGTPPYSYQWNDPAMQTVNPAISLCTGTYIVTVTDARNCAAIDTVFIADLSIGRTFVAWADDDTIYEGQTVQLHSTHLGSGYIYLWTPPYGLSDITSPDPKASPTSTTTYIVISTDIYGCEYTDTVTIWVEDVICEEPYIFIPNAFTPNADNINDVLYVRTNYAEKIYLAIYNRWGEKVFETTNIENGWDGYYKDRLSDPGVFAYYLEVTCYNKILFVKKGNITLIR